MSEKDRLERLAEYVERVVNGAPPLNDDQRDKIGALLGRGQSFVVSTPAVVRIAR